LVFLQELTCELSYGCETDNCQQGQSAIFHLGLHFLHKLVWRLFSGS